MGEFSFKGSRDYLHSTTVFDWILGQIDPPQSIDFIFNRKTVMQCVLVDAGKEVAGEVVGTWKDAAHDFRIVAEESKPILARVAYDEDAIVKDCQFEATSVLVPDDGGSSTFIERLVAAYKGLLLRQDGLAETKFVFARLRLKHVPKNAFVVTHKRTMGAGFYQGDISVDGERIGEIYYGRWK